jgi:tRNA dimethylallyltransferase
MKKIIIISGPTASGKTSISIELAKKFNAEIVNFDSLIFYKELNIGTAKPSIEERNGVTHHLIDIESAKNPIHAAKFVELAEPIVEEVHKRNKPVILVGGSGFYVQALINGMYESINTSEEVEQRSEDLYEAEGITPFIEILKKNDPINYERLHENDHYRIRRAVEHYWATGDAFSKSQEKMTEKKLNYEQKGWEVLHIYLDIPKEEHLPYIYKRTNEMIANHFIEEVKNLLANGFSGHEKPLQSVGYKQVQMFLSGEYKTMDELIERINISTRRLAKAQRTWFKTKEKINYHPLEQRSEIIKAVENFLHSF